MRRSQHGFSVLEAVLVVALVVVLGIATVVVFARGAAADHAREVARTLTAMRWRAVLHGVPITVRPAGHDAVWVVEGTYVCDAEAVAGARRVELEAAPALSVWPTHAVAFAPDGRPRSCSGGGVGSATIEISDRRGERAAVIVSALGRVRWERR